MANKPCCCSLGPPYNSMCEFYLIFMLESYITHEDFRPSVRLSRSWDPPWILKWGELESSGQRLISSIGKTKILAFFSAEKINSNFMVFRFFE